MDKNQMVAKELRKQGIEMTPEEVRDVTSSAAAKIRAELQHLNPPDDDDALLEWFGAMIRS